MKRLGIIVTALAFLTTLTQCKKEEQPTNEDKDVAITLDIRNTRGTRMDVNTGTGEVTYENGDIIYVASGGKFIGILTHNGTNFTGTITDPTIGEPLHFYFLGNVTPAETLTAGTTTTCSVVISDQTERLPVIEYAPSNETYISGTTTFTAMLLNKCALVKFNVTTSSESATCITGMKNKVTVSFAENTLTHSQEGNGVITLPAGNGEKWAILLPQEAVEEGNVYSEDGEYTGTFGAVPAITDNSLLTVGIEVNVTTEAIPAGAINGKFTINANGDQVYFSKGNLQYQASTNVWRFAESQWNYVGEDNSNISENYDGWIDLFGWGTSGYNHGAVCYMPYSISTNESDYFAYGGYTYNLYDQTGQADWGYNAISNGGNTEGQWRTLTLNESYYLFYERPTLSGIRYTLGNVNGVGGVILLPNDWNEITYNLNNTNNEYAVYSDNSITGTDWTDVFEASGAVFLPAAGGRVGTSVDFAGNSGFYWYASYDDSGFAYDYYLAYTLSFFSGNVGHCSSDRSGGYSVRLVRDVE